MSKPRSKPKWEKIKADGTTLRYQQGGDNEGIAKAIAAGLESRKKEAKAKAAAKAALPPPDLRPKKHLVAFVDILGFGHELKKAETEADLKLIYAKVRKVQEAFLLAGACDESEHQFENNAEYGRRVLALSDSIVVAITPNCPMQPLMGGYELLGCALYELIIAQGQCACQGIFVRGGVSHGPFFFENDVLISPAQARAYDLETNAAEFPIIVVTESTRQARFTLACAAQEAWDEIDTNFKPVCPAPSLQLARTFCDLAGRTVLHDVQGLLVLPGTFFATCLLQSRLEQEGRFEEIIAPAWRKRSAAFGIEVPDQELEQWRRQAEWEANPGNWFLEHIRKQEMSRGPFKRDDHPALKDFLFNLGIEELNRLVRVQHRKTGK